MKKQLALAVMLILALSACRQPGLDAPDVPGGEDRTYVVFDNTGGTTAVSVFNASRRDDADRITVVNSSQTSGSVRWTPGDVTVFLSYPIRVNGFEGFSRDFRPPVGPDQIRFNAVANSTTTVPIPGLVDVVQPLDRLLFPSESFLVIRNDSAFTFELQRGSSTVTPDNMPDFRVPVGQTAHYTISPGSASNYRVSLLWTDVYFPGGFEFAAGHIYFFVFNGIGITLERASAIRLENVDDPAAGIPSAPSAPLVRALDASLQVSWTAVTWAESYDIFLSTESIPPDSPTRTVSGTATLFMGLENRTPYYVWVRAVNNAGTSGLSPYARAVPWPVNAVPQTPERPVVIPGVNSLIVTWEGSAGAASYEVFISETMQRPSLPEATTEETTVIIEDVEEGVIYHLWVRAVNAAGRSGQPVSKLG